MDSLDNATLMLIVLVALMLVAGIAWLAWRSRRTRRLQQRFGPEYEDAVRRLGSRARAEKELEQRERRVQGLQIVALSPADVARFSQTWTRLQGSFVDDPKGVLIEADRLVRDVMTRRGYPMADFELRAADISVSHPGVVSNYRAAQRIVSLDQRGEASTEDLRKAVVHFRALFDEMLGANRPPERPAPPRA